MDFANLTLIEATDTLRPLFFFVMGMAIYAIFIFNFYRFLGRKNIFELDVAKYEQSKHRSFRILMGVIFYVAKYLVLFPIVAFAWFIILTVLLSFLAKRQPIDTILLIAMAVLSAIRVTAYYNEDLSKDLAKILPFALLGVFLIDLSYFSISASVEALQQAYTQWESVVYYLGFVIGLEFLLRVTSPFLGVFFTPRKQRT